MKLLAGLRRSFWRSGDGDGDGGCGNEAFTNGFTTSGCRWCDCLSVNSLEWSSPKEKQRQLDEKELGGQMLFSGFLSIGTLGSNTPIIECEEGEEEDDGNEKEQKQKQEDEHEEEREEEEEEEAILTGCDLVTAATLTFGKKPAEVQTVVEEEKAEVHAVVEDEKAEVQTVVEVDKVAAAGKHRRSLAELFMVSKEEHDEAANVGGETGALRLMKMLKWRGAGPRKGGGTASTFQNKLQEVLRIFHVKVHPEQNTSAKRMAGAGEDSRRITNPKKKKTTTTKKNHNDHPGVDSNHHLHHEDILHSPPNSINNKRIKSFESGVNNNISNFFKCRKSLSQMSESDASSGREYWIKTDADYLVLELQKCSE